MKIIHKKDIPVTGVSHDPDIKKQVLISNGIIPKLTTFSTAVFKPGQIATRHNHPTMIEVFHILEGVMHIEIEGQEFDIEKGDLVVIEQGEFHAQSNQKATDLVLLYFGIATD